MTIDSAPFQALDARSGAEVRLAMQSLWLSGRVLPAGARLMVRHVFRSAETRPLEVVYSFGLPRDAALRRFRVTGEGFSMHSELKPVEEAVKDYEAGLEAGHLATLAREHRDGVVNLTVGNLRPKETVTVWLDIVAGVEPRDDGFRFRFPFTLAPSYHPRARMAEAEHGRGEIELPEDEFGDVMLPRWAADAEGLHEVGFDLAVAVPGAAEEIASPSHALRVGRGGRVSLAVAGDVPDRDLVLDVRTPAGGGVETGTDREGKGRFAAVVPSTRFGMAPEGARSVVIVLDRSGSMDGAPIEQARKAIAACLGALGAGDRFGLIAFDDQVEAFQPGLAKADMGERRRAHAFLDGIDARGGTELGRALEHAAKMLGEGGGDALVLTDGQVSGTEEILDLAHRIGMRIHCLGIGSASQDRFLALLARETGGVSRFVTARERVDMAAVDLFAAAGRPMASGLTVSGATVALAPPPAVCAGTPVVLFGETAGPGPAHLAFSWPGGGLGIDFTVEAGAGGETLRLLAGARLITDLEARQGESKREDSRIAKRLEALSREYGLASRAMALVAVVERAGDRAGDVPKTVVVPVGMPQDTAFRAYFGTAAPGGASRLYRRSMQASCDLVQASAPPPAKAGFGLLRMVASQLTPSQPAGERLLDFAARMEPDGGMPGADAETRAAATAAALLAFLAEGHTPDRGAFRSHVRRLAEFLRQADLPDAERALADRVLELVGQGRPLAGPWADAVGQPGGLWRRLRRALK